MSLRSIENTFIYKHLNNDNRVSEQILEVLQKGTVITKSNIEEQILIINKNFKYPLKFKILEEFEKGGIRLMWSPENVKLPLALPFFLTRDKNGDVIGVIILDLFGSMDKDTHVVSIEPKKLYTLMEATYFAKICYLHNNKIVTRNTVISYGSAIYSNIITRVFNKKYALNLDKNKLNKMLFLASKFYLVNILGLADTDMTFNYASKACVGANPYSIQEANSAFNATGFADFAAFILELKNPALELNFKDIQVRGFLETFISMYEPSMLLSLESFPYFFYNILSVMNGAYLNNQYVLEDIISTHGAKIYSDLISIE